MTGFDEDNFRFEVRDRDADRITFLMIDGELHLQSKDHGLVAPADAMAALARNYMALMLTLADGGPQVSAIKARDVFFGKKPDDAQ